MAGGLALAGLRPVAHTFAPFLVERPFEQVKLDLGHQEAGAVLVSAGGSYDYPAYGLTHLAPGDVALLDTLPGWTVHVPGHPDEAEQLLRTAIAGSGKVYLRLSLQANARPLAGPGPGFTVLSAAAAADGHRGRAGGRRRPGRHGGPGRDGAVRRDGPAVRRAPGCGRRWPARRRSLWSSRTWPGRRRARSLRR